MDLRVSLGRASLLGSCALFAQLGCADVRSLGDGWKEPPKSRPVEELVELEPSPPIAQRDLFYGPGGRELVPRADAAFRFLEKDTSGMSTNFEVVDAQGRHYDAKFGHEVRAEVAASRILWAIGFYQAPLYYVPAWKIEGGLEAGPQPEARFRFEDPDWKKDGEWAWQASPFAGTRELNGLLVTQILINNWDLKTSNNKVYRRSQATPHRIFVVKDLGQAFGHTVHFFVGNTDDPPAFANEGFINKVDGQHVSFEFDPVLLNLGVERGVEVDDVLWACRRLAQLRDEQWHDAFRAAGFAEPERVTLVDAMKRKVQEGLALEQRARS